VKHDLLCDVLMCCAMLLIGFGIGMAVKEQIHGCKNCGLSFQFTLTTTGHQP
jgi:transcription elongation factor Elf1